MSETGQEKVNAIGDAVELGRQNTVTTAVDSLSAAVDAMDLAETMRAKNSIGYVAGGFMGVPVEDPFTSAPFNPQTPSYEQVVQGQQAA